MLDISLIKFRPFRLVYLLWLTAFMWYFCGWVGLGLLALSMIDVEFNVEETNVE